MKDRLRRQARLLAIRTIQADLAANEMLRLQSKQAGLSTTLTHLHQKARCAMTYLEGPSLQQQGWLLACAEGEMASIAASRLRDEALVLQEQISVHTALEQEARRQREQMSRLHERTLCASRTLDEHQAQARLDDLFCAVRSRFAVRSSKRSV